MKKSKRRQTNLISTVIVLITVALMVFLAIFMFILILLAVTYEWFGFEDLSYLFLMVSILVFALQSLRVVLSFGTLLFAYILIANFATDTFAYFGGYFFGKHKLNPRISPKKTVEGSVVGYIMSAIISFVFSFVFLKSGELPWSVYLTASLTIPFVSQIGDLAFSLVKRHYNIKDFGSIFPGHGGVLDRVDSVIFSLIAFNVILLLFV